jgi:photosystem II stability/assembly factor-like uncharacterized protein
LKALLEGQSDTLQLKEVAPPVFGGVAALVSGDLMRFKLIVTTLILASLACTANVSVLNTPAPPSETTPTESTPLVSVPPLEGLPIVVPSDISSIQMIDTQNGWMITNTFVLRSMDGGATWHDVTPQGASTLGYGTGASFLDSNVGWILIGDPQNPLNTGRLYHTHDGGIHWDEYVTPFGSGELHFLDPRNGWVMIVAGADAGNMPVLFYQTNDGGVNWTQVYNNLPGDPGEQNSLPASGVKSGFTPINMQEAWVSGRSSATNSVYLYHTTDSGHTWSAVNPNLPFGGEAIYLTQPPVFFGSQIGLLPTMAGSEGSGMFFFVTQDGGSTWTPGAGLPGSGPISVISPNDVFVLVSGVIFVSRDASQTWSSVTPNMDLNASMISGFQFVDTQTGWVVLNSAGGRTSLYKTTDGGQTWAAQIQ